MQNVYIFFFFNDPATTEIYTLSLHDALPIWSPSPPRPRSPSDLHLAAGSSRRNCRRRSASSAPRGSTGACRSEEHTSELQSRLHLVCRLLLEKKKKYRTLTRFHTTD